MNEKRIWQGPKTGPDRLWEQTASSLAALIRAREVSALEVTESVLARIEEDRKSVV